MVDLVPPHGGLAEPVCRTVPQEAIDDFLADAQQLPTVPVSDADLSTVYRLGDGGLSPLVGPMDSVIGDDAESVIYSFLTRMPHRLSVGKGRASFNAILVDVDKASGRAVNIQRIEHEEENLDEI